MTDYATTGASLFNQSYATAIQASQTGIPTARGMFATALALAAKALPEDVAKVVNAAESTATDAEAGAAIGSMLWPGVGTAVGAAIGAVIGLLSGIVGQWGASSDTTDRRPFPVQAASQAPMPGTDASDPLLNAANTDLIAYLNTRGMMGLSFGQGPKVSQLDLAAAYARLVGDFTNFGSVPQAEAKAKADAAIARYDRWNFYSCAATGALGILSQGMRCPFHDCASGGTPIFGPCEDPYGLSIDYRLVNAAVLAWTDHAVYAYLVGMKTLWHNQENVDRKITPADELDARIGYMASLIPGMVPAGTGLIIALPQGPKPILVPSSVFRMGPIPTRSTPAQTVAKVGAAGLAVWLLVRLLL